MKHKPKLAVWTPFAQAVLHEDPDRHATLLKASRANAVFRNSRYTVYVRVLPLGFVHLSIKRNDRSPMHDWRELQRIKTALMGPEVEAVEIYPAESRVVDGSNQYHLFCYPRGIQCPLGFFDGRWVTEGSVMGEKQRPFEDVTPEFRAELERSHMMVIEILKKRGWLREVGAKTTTAEEAPAGKD